jgi:peptide/nickel transport system ATP-binding protein
MNKGQIVEFGSTAEIFKNPQQEYTRNLLDAIPGAKLL